MDLLEARSSATRHPWELSRARAVATIVRRHLPGPLASILDWGCGDAFTGRFLLDRLGAARLVGIDPNLTEAQRREYSLGDARVTLVSQEHELPPGRFDLVLCCDVIEHLPDDAGTLAMLSRSYLAEAGRLIVTVPAFQGLFTAHDVALKHYRRYSLAALERVLGHAGLGVLGSGYLFGSLLPVRAVEKFSKRTPSANEAEAAVGLGRWRGGPLTTRLTQALLSADNALLLTLAAHGVKLPGLSAWAACSLIDDRSGG